MIQKHFELSDDEDSESHIIPKVSEAETLLMLILAPHERASPNGIYGPRIIDESWIKFFEDQRYAHLVHIESWQDELDGSWVYRLWRMKEWRETAQARHAQAHKYDAQESLNWELRFRFKRTLLRLKRAKIPEKTAKGLISDCLALANTYPGAIETLKQYGYYDEVTTEDLTDFIDNWRPVVGHVYADPHDLRQEHINDEESDE